MNKSFSPFQKGLHQVSVIHTDLVEAESLIRQLAENESKEHPRDFAGNAPCVYYKLPYVPPCDPFHELRRLILRIHESTGLRAEFKGIVAIEATEWLGHEREAYFTVLLKYLYDHRDTWRPAFVINTCTQAQAQKFAAGCSRYISPRIFDIQIFENRNTLAHIISQSFHARSKKITGEASGMLAAALMSPELKSARSLILIDRIAQEILAYAASAREISTVTIRGYLMNPYSTPTMMAGKNLFVEGSVSIENDALQL